MLLTDLSLLPYRETWLLQEQAHARVAAGGPEELLLVEHPPVITFGRRTTPHHLLASEQALKDRGVDLVQSDRGGDITFHGPGQLVAYPIIRLADHHLSVGAYVHTLQQALLETLAAFNIQAQLDPTAIGVWVNNAKIAALGVRVKKGVTLHGLALNVTTDLSYFNLIIPCGLQGRPVTSLLHLLGPATPTMPQVKQALTQALRAAFSFA
jgi:lipoate-protein ligase B